MDTSKQKTQMKRGVLELCILSIIAEKDSYASDILNRLKNSKLIVVEGTLYPLLTRLKKDGLTSYHWEESKSGPPRKYYKITETGKKILEELESSWNEISESVNSIIKSNK